jgi:hypothetical protein
LVIEVFDRKTLKNNNIVDDFFDKIGIDLTKYKINKSSEKNLSLNYIGQCLLRTINSEASVKQEAKPKLLQFINNEFAGQGENVDVDTYRRLFESFDVMNKTVNVKYRHKDGPLFPYSPLEATNRIEGVEQVVKEILPLIEFAFSATIDDSYADVCRDAAVSFEESSIETAYKLMSLAHQIRPHGPVIKKKLSDYKKLMS